MSSHVLSKLLAPIAGESPAGGDLEYAPEFLQMVQLAQSTPEQQYGATIIAAREPDWTRVASAAMAVAQQTRDLRVANALVKSWTWTHGVRGLADGMELISSWTRTFWSHIYPMLDAEENNDPTQRMSVIAELTHRDHLLRAVLDMPLLEHRTLGAITLRSIQRIANQSNTTASERSDSVRDVETNLQAVLQNTDASTISEQLRNVERAIHSFQLLDTFLQAKLDSYPWDARPLMDLLHLAQSTLSHHIGPAMVAGQRRPSVRMVGSPAHDPTSMDLIEDTLEAIQKTEQPSPSPSAPHLLRISNREEAMAVLESVCEYFEHHEPASPVPLVLQRAKRLIPMSFVDILRELAPEGLPQVMRQFASSEEGKR